MGKYSFKNLSWEFFKFLANEITILVEKISSKRWENTLGWNISLIECFCQLKQQILLQILETFKLNKGGLL